MERDMRKPFAPRRNVAYRCLSRCCGDSAVAVLTYRRSSSLYVPIKALGANENDPIAIGRL